MANATKYVDGAAGNDANSGNSPGAGNAYATIGAAISAISGGGNIVYVKASATYTLTSTQTITWAGDFTDGSNLIEGYTTTPGARDGRPTFTTATNNVPLFTSSVLNYMTFRHLKFTNTAGTRAAAVVGGGASATLTLRIEDCLSDGCTYLFDGTTRAANHLSVIGCGVINGTGLALNGGVNASGAPDQYIGNYVYNMTGTAIVSNTSAVTANIVGNVFASCSYGVQDTNTIRTSLLILLNNTFVDIANDAVRTAANTGSLSIGLAGNLFYGIGGYGVRFTTDPVVENNNRLLFNYGNFFGAMTSGQYSGLAAGLWDVTGLSDPFVSRAGQDYRLNSTAGAGALVRAARLPLTFPGASFSAYADGGAVQHQDSGGGGGGGLMGCAPINAILG